MSAGMLARADQVAAAIQEALDGIDSGQAAATDRQAAYLLGALDGLAIVRGMEQFVPPNLPRLDPTDG